ncbi:hypothetical protein [Planktotalea sp.]|uniref:hypothetical protein n=1 Tax=Planktotalea sp. TaxID=2029877 RepID=UPI0032972441
MLRVTKIAFLTLFTLTISNTAVLAHDDPNEKLQDAAKHTNTIFKEIDAGRLDLVAAKLDPRLKTLRRKDKPVDVLQSMQSRGVKFSGSTLHVIVQPRELRHPAGFPNGHYTSVVFGSKASAKQQFCGAILWRYHRNQWYIHKVENSTAQILSFSNALRLADKKAAFSELCKGIRPKITSYTR